MNLSTKIGDNPGDKFVSDRLDLFAISCLANCPFFLHSSELTNPPQDFVSKVYFRETTYSPSEALVV